MLHVLVGSDEDIALVLNAAKRGETALWVVPKKAQVNDRVLIHLPRKGFTARALIGSNPKRFRAGGYEADLKDIALLPTSVPLAFVRKNHPTWKWPTYPRGFTTIDGAIEQHLIELLDKYQDSPEEPIIEGQAKTVAVRVYERDPVARQKCIDHYGAKCFACDFSFGAKYGEMFDEYIHVHHLELIARKGGKHAVNPIRDLRPVCPNCHAVIHRSDPPMKIEELKRLLKRNKVVRYSPL